MPINNDHITGFLFGLGVAGLGFYYYKKNQIQVDAWLREQGIELPQPPARDYSTMTLEELVLEKERIEDLIAERDRSFRAANLNKPKVEPQDQLDPKNEDREEDNDCDDNETEEEMEVEA